MGASFEEHLLSVKMACGSFGNVCKVIGLLLFVSLFFCFLVFPLLSISVLAFKMVGNGHAVISCVPKIVGVMISPLV